MRKARLPGIVQMLAILGVAGTLAYAAAGPAWHSIGVIALDDPPAPPRRPEAEAIPPPDLTPIVALRPFGAADAPAPAATPVQETRLDLVLRGVALNPIAENSFALIADAGVTRNYRPGDPINDRARLAQVFAQYVVLDVAGREEILSFPLSSIMQASADAGPAATEEPESPFVIANAPIDVGVTEEPQTTEDYIELWRERINRNPGEVLDAIGLIATDKGYRIAEKHDSGVALAGLRPGDLVTTVNGQAVGNVEQDRKFYDEVAASGQARIELMRGGKPIVMSFPLR